MQNSGHFGKNGVSNLVREGTNFRAFLPLILCAFTEKRANLVRTAGDKREKKTNVFGFSS